MGLKAAMKAAEAEFPTLVSASQRVLVSQNQHAATILFEGDCCYSSVASSQLEAPVCYLKCKVHVREEWMFFGIGKSPDMAHTLPWTQINTYGWSTCSIIVNGKAQQSHGKGWQADDWFLLPLVQLKLDLPNKMLSISASTAGTMFMPIPGFTEAPGHPVFLIILSSGGDHIQLLPVTSEDRLLL